MHSRQTQTKKVWLNSHARLVTECYANSFLLNHFLSCMICIPVYLGLGHDIDTCLLGLGLEIIITRASARA